jgi:peptide/nickel transport system substrate-binding protein
MIDMQQIILNEGAGLFFGYPKTNMVSSTSITGAEILPADYYWLTKDIRPAKS